MPEKLKAPEHFKDSLLQKMTKEFGRKMMNILVLSAIGANILFPTPIRAETHTSIERTLEQKKYSPEFQKYFEALQNADEAIAKDINDAKENFKNTPEQKEGAYKAVAKVIQEKIIPALQNKLTQEIWEEKFPNETFQTSEAYQLVEQFIKDFQNIAEKLNNWKSQKQVTPATIDLNLLPDTQAYNTFKEYLQQENWKHSRRFTLAEREHEGHQKNAERIIKIWAEAKTVSEEDFSFIRNYLSLNNLSYIGGEKDAFSNEANCAGFLDVSEQFLGEQPLSKFIQIPEYFAHYYNNQNDHGYSRDTDNVIRPQKYNFIRDAWNIANSPGMKKLIPTEQELTWFNEVTENDKRVWKLHFDYEDIQTFDTDRAGHVFKNEVKNIRENLSEEIFQQIFEEKSYYLKFKAKSLEELQEQLAELDSGQAGMTELLELFEKYKNGREWTVHSSLLSDVTNFYEALNQANSNSVYMTFLYTHSNYAWPSAGYETIADVKNSLEETVNVKKGTEIVKQKVHPVEQANRVAPNTHVVKVSPNAKHFEKTVDEEISLKDFLQKNVFNKDRPNHARLESLMYSLIYHLHFSITDANGEIVNMNGKSLDEIIIPAGSTATWKDRIMMDVLHGHVRVIPLSQILVDPTFIPVNVIRPASEDEKQSAELFAENINFLDIPATTELKAEDLKDVAKEIPKEIQDISLKMADGNVLLHKAMMTIVYEEYFKGMDRILSDSSFMGSLDLPAKFKSRNWYKILGDDVKSVFGDSAAWKLLRKKFPNSHSTFAKLTMIQESYEPASVGIAQIKMYGTQSLFWFLESKSYDEIQKLQSLSKDSEYIKFFEWYNTLTDAEKSKFSTEKYLRSPEFWSSEWYDIIEPLLNDSDAGALLALRSGIEYKQSKLQRMGQLMYGPEFTVSLQNKDHWEVLVNSHNKALHKHVIAGHQFVIYNLADELFGEKEHVIDGALGKDYQDTLIKIFDDERFKEFYGGEVPTAIKELYLSKLHPNSLSNIITQKGELPSKLREFYKYIMEQDGKDTSIPFVITKKLIEDKQGLYHSTLPSRGHKQFTK